MVVFQSILQKKVWLDSTSEKVFFTILSIHILKEVVLLRKPEWWHLKKKLWIVNLLHFLKWRRPKMTEGIEFFALQFNELSKMRKTKRLIKFFKLDVDWCYLVSVLNLENQQENEVMKFQIRIHKSENIISTKSERQVFDLPQNKHSKQEKSS